MAYEITRDQLATSELLRAIPAGALNELAAEVSVVAFRSGEVVCEAGDAGTCAYLVLRGRLQATAGGQVVGEIGRGELVGEMSLLTGQPRTATVTALRDSEALVLDADVFNTVLARHPHCYQAVSRQLVDRLHRVLTTPWTTDRATVVTVVHESLDLGV